MGGQSLKYVSVQFTRSALAYEAQVKVRGGHSAAVRKALKAALKQDQKQVGKLGSRKPPTQSVLRPGTHLVREWNGRTYQVEGSCQTDEIRSLQWQDSCPLCNAELAPLSKSSGAVGFETVSRVEMTFLVEMIADRGVDGDEFL